MQKFLLILLFSIASLSVSRAQEIEILFHVLELKSSNSSTVGSLEVSLPTFTSDHQKVLEYNFSTLPTEVISNNQEYKAQWTAKDLRGIESIQIQTTIVSSKSKKINVPVISPKRITSSEIKQAFKKNKSWISISSQELYSRYQYRFLNNRPFLSSTLSNDSGPVDTRIKNYWTRDTEEILKKAYNFYRFNENRIASFIFEILAKEYSTDQKFQRFRAIALSRIGGIKRPLEILNQLKESARNKKELAEVYYTIANHYAIIDEKEKAVENLLAAQKTYRYFNLCLADRDYDFHNLVKYQPFLDIIKNCH